MKAALYMKYGGPEVLQIKEVAMPTPKEDEILIRIKATAVNSGDVRLRKADPFAVRFFFGLWKPKVNILGSVFSGEVESAGSNVKLFKKGDQVFGHTDMKFGAYAEYICVKENSSLAVKPFAASHSEAAAIPFGGVTALHFLKKALIKPGQKILIIGASGAVGTAAVQLAKSYGAFVTGVCSTANIELVRSIGADKVIDYTGEDFTQSDKTYDVIFATVNENALTRCLKSIAKNGVLIVSAAGMNDTLKAFWYSKTSGRKIITGVTSHSAADIIFLKELTEAGKFKPVIDRTYPLTEIADAHRYVEKGHKKGNVIIHVQN